MALGRALTCLAAAGFSLAALCSNAWAQAADDLNARIRARIQAAKLLAVPKPPPGVQDLAWSAMAPPGWSAIQLLREHDVHDHGSSAKPSFATDLRGVAARTSLRQQWDSAPTVSDLVDTPVRLFGYPVMLESGTGLSGSIVLVPYLSDGDVRPHPPANQMVVVALKPGLPRNLERTPIWITGRMYAVRTPTPLGKAGYLIADGKWQKYPYPEYPLPGYALPR